MEPSTSMATDMQPLQTSTEEADETQDGEDEERQTEEEEAEEGDEDDSMATLVDKLADELFDVDTTYAVPDDQLDELDEVQEGGCPLAVA